MYTIKKIEASLKHTVTLLCWLVFKHIIMLLRPKLWVTPLRAFKGAFGSLLLWTEIEYCIDVIFLGPALVPSTKPNRIFPLTYGLFEKINTITRSKKA